MNKKFNLYSLTIQQHCNDSSKICEIYLNDNSFFNIFLITTSNPAQTNIIVNLNLTTTGSNYDLRKSTYLSSTNHKSYCGF